MGIKLEEIVSNGNYCKKDNEFGGSNDGEGVWSITSDKKEEEKVYTYDEAIDLTGNGWYNISLLVTLALAIQGMGLDMFGFSYVVAAARCDLQLSHNQTSFLLSVPLMGSIISAYFHGYFADTRGRKKSLTVALWASFIISALSSLSPNFTVLAIFKFFSSSICSGIQSMSYTLLGESCSVRTKEPYIMIITSALMCVFGVFTAHAYIMLGLDFNYDLGFVIFKPWRLLILSMAMALGSSGVFMVFFYESPKYLVHAGKTVEAIKILEMIKKRNGGKGIYPVKKIILLDECATQCNDVSFVRSLWDQIAPLFTPPLLQRTLLLFYILAALYSVNNGFYIWIPIIFSSFFEELATRNNTITESFCDLISTHSQDKTEDCTSVVSLETLLMSIIQGLVFVAVNYGASRMVHRKKTVVIVISVFASVCCIAMLFITEKITTIIFFFGVQLNCLAMGITFCYIIELFPTRYRGMITSLGVMVARGSALVGVNLVGAYTFTHCKTSLYCWGAYGFSGALMAFMLPQDVPKKSKRDSKLTSSL